MSIEFVRSLPYDHPFRWDATPVGGSKLWRPDELGADLALWLDAEDAASITLNGTDVAQWDDKSSKGWDVSQSTAASQPAYDATGLNGKPAVDFDTSSKDLRASNAASDWNFLHNSGGSGVFMVANFDNIASGILPFFLTRTAVTGLFLRYRDTDRMNPVIAEDGTIFVNYTSANNSYPSSTDLIFGWQHASSLSSNAQIYIDGALESQGNYSVAPVGGFDADVPLRIGGGAVCRSGEVVVVSVLLSTEDRENLEGYLAWHWELEANLPVGHPYASTPPIVAAGTGFNFTAWNFPFLRG